MKIVTMIPFLLVNLLFASFTQNATKTSYEKELKLTIVFEKSKAKNSYDIIRLYLTNLSKTKNYKIITPGDGSESGWREPYIYFTAECREANGKWKQLEKRRSSRCGLFDAEWQKDTATINQSEKIQIYYMASENVIRLFNVTTKGAIRLTAHYDYKQGQHQNEHSGETSNEYKEVNEQENIEKIKDVPAFMLTSDTIEINLKK